MIDLNFVFHLLPLFQALPKSANIGNTDVWGVTLYLQEVE